MTLLLEVVETEYEIDEDLTLPVKQIAFINTENGSTVIMDPDEADTFCDDLAFLLANEFNIGLTRLEENDGAVV